MNPEEQEAWDNFFADNDYRIKCLHKQRMLIAKAEAEREHEDEQESVTLHNT